jgi:hypothetical protein
MKLKKIMQNTVTIYGDKGLQTVNNSPRLRSNLL